jgi:hypothetical protein
MDNPLVWEEEAKGMPDQHHETLAGRERDEMRTSGSQKPKQELRTLMAAKTKKSLPLGRPMTTASARETCQFDGRICNCKSMSDLLYGVSLEMVKLNAHWEAAAVAIP